MLGRNYRQGQTVWAGYNGKWYPGVVQARGTFRVLIQLVEGLWAPNAFLIWWVHIRPLTSQEENDVAEAIRNLQLMQKKNNG